MVSPRLVALVLATCGGAFGVAADPPKSHLERLRASATSLGSSDAAMMRKELEGDPLALPVIRQAVERDDGFRESLRRIATSCLKNRDRALLHSVEQWAKDGRLDLLTEVRSLSDGEAAEAAEDGLLRAAAELGGTAEHEFQTRTPTTRPAFRLDLPWANGKALRASKTKPRFDTQLDLPEQADHRRQAFFADRIEAPSALMWDSLVVCRSELKHFALTVPNHVGRCEWERSLLFANTSVRFQEAKLSVLVLDGDLSLSPMSNLAGSVVVVSGNVDEYGKNNLGPYVASSVVWATGDITLTPHPKPHYCTVFIAGGKVADAEKLAAKGCAFENAKEFPVRFLDPADFGLTLEATKDGMRVVKVADKSAFADVLKAGDVVTAVTGVKTPSPAAFRRELRRGIIEGATIFAVTRGSDKLELLAAVPDVPPAPKKKDADLEAKPPEMRDDKK